MNLKLIFPILDWLPRYKKQDLRGDISAGLTVGVMLIPQGMAYSMLAGLPPIFGLYASTIPIFLYALLGSSRQLAVGPVAMASLLVASGLAPLVDTNTAPETYLQLAILLTFMVGCIRLLLGVLRLGFVVNFLSQPVISGYSSAAAIIIGLSQLKYLLGIPIPNSNYIHIVLWHAAAGIVNVNPFALLIGIGGILFLQALKGINKKYRINIPGPLAIIFIASLVVLAFGLNTQGLAIVGEVPKGLPHFSLPLFDWKVMESLLPAATTIAIVGFMESIAVAKAIQAKHKTYKISPNQELIALGVANIGGAFFQAFPVNGGFSRTAVNDQAGARTPMASIFSALLIILTLLFLTPLFYYLPQAVLASVVMTAVYGLIDFKELRHLWKTDRRDFWMLVLTFVATLGLGVVEGILLGVVISLGLLIYRSTYPHVAVLGRMPGTHHYRNLKRFPNLETRPDLLIVRFDGELYFANSDYFIVLMQQLIQQKGEALKVFILDAESISNIDSSAMHAIDDFLTSLKKQGILWLWCDLKGPSSDTLERASLTEKIGRTHFFMSVQDAVDYVDNGKC